MLRQGCVIATPKSVLNHNMTYRSCSSHQMHQGQGPSYLWMRNMRWNNKKNKLFLFVSVQKLFSTFKVLGASEMSLGANQWKEHMTRLSWNNGKESVKSLEYITHRTDLKY